MPTGLSIAAAEAAGFQVLASVPNRALRAQVYRLELPAGQSASAAAAELQSLLPGSVADENHLFRLDDFACTDDGCLAHAAIGWSGWPSAFGPRIGMIDTGIDRNHPTLRNQAITVFQTGVARGQPAEMRHGTAIASLLVGRLDSPVPGLLPNAELVAVEAFRQDTGGEAADAFSLVTAMDFLMESNVRVINMSFSGPENELLRLSVEEAAAGGIGMVAAAGNGGPGADPLYPAAWPQVLAVTAVDRDLQPYRQANRGPYISLAAPGVSVWAAAMGGGGDYRSGTSYAAPFVTAALAVELERTPQQAVPTAVSRLTGCARDIGASGFDPIFGHGLVSAPDQCVGDTGQNFFTSGE